MSKPKWIKKATANIQKFNQSLSPSQKALHASKAGKAGWNSLTPEEQSTRIKKMLAGRK